MKDKVITLKDNTKVYTLDELDYKGKKYVFAAELDDNGEPIEEKMYALEVSIDNDVLSLKEIEDFEVASVVNNLFIVRLQENN